MVTMQHKESTILQISKETAPAPLKKDLELTFGRFFFKFRPVFSAFLFAAHLFFEFLEKKRKHYSAYTVINTIYSNIASWLWIC